MSKHDTVARAIKKHIGLEADDELRARWNDGRYRTNLDRFAACVLGIAMADEHDESANATARRVHRYAIAECRRVFDGIRLEPGAVITRAQTEEIAERVTDDVAYHLLLGIAIDRPCYYRRDPMHDLGLMLQKMGVKLVPGEDFGTIDPEWFACTMRHAVARHERPGVVLATTPSAEQVEQMKHYAAMRYPLADKNRSEEWAKPW